jgi:hypothetical protein
MGGSFILEASTTGQNGSWVPMIAENADGKFLGREGFIAGGPGLTGSGHNAVAFSKNIFTIKSPTSSIPPDTVTPQSIPALKQSSTTTCTIRLSRGDNNWDKTKNIKEDFSVHCISSSINAPPYWSAGIQFNCIVTGYDSGSGILTFNVTPTLSGLCKFLIIVRNEGTGMIIAELVTSSPFFNIEADEYFAAKTFAVSSSNTIVTNASATFIAFKNAYMPANNTCDMKRFAWRQIGTPIPTWSSLYNNSSQVSYLYQNIYTNLVGNPPEYGGGTNAPMGNVGYLGQPENTNLFRYMWKFTSETLVTTLMFYTSTPGWQSEYVNFEIVASNNGTDFVRLPTEWRVSGIDTIEDTFHLKYDRYSKGGKRTFLFAEDLTPVMNNTSSTNISTGKYLINIGPGIKPIVGMIKFVNTVAYQYYGFGNVGSDTPYSGSDWSATATKTRTYARVPYSDYSLNDHTTNPQWLITNGSIYQAVMKDTTMRVAMPWLSNQGFGNYFFPVPSTVTADPSRDPIRYKYWRIRATSAFLGACGAATKAYFWKLGLYRNATVAAADTYGLSSNNYLQQFANVLGISTNGTAPTTQSGTKRNAMFVSKGDWTQVWGNATQFALVDGTTALQTNAVDVTFNAELACIQFTLDVVGEIGAIRFPDNMYYDANVRGGTFIVEAATAAAPTTWVLMVATAGGATLGREGTLGTVPVASGSAGNQTLINKVFTLSAPLNAYVWPDSLGTFTTPTLAYNVQSSSCSVVISGGSSASNVLGDFSACLISTNTWTLGATASNCILDTYSSNMLSFRVTPNFVGAARLAVYVRSTEGTGVCGAQLTSTDVMVPRTFIYTGVLYENVQAALDITIASPLTGLTSGSALVKVFYSASSAAASPTLCSSDSGTAVSAAGQSSVLCTIPLGTWYLYIGLSVDGYVVSSQATTTINVRSAMEKAVLLSATTTQSGVPIYDVYVNDLTARTFWDLTLGGSSSTFGFIASFRDGGNPDLIYNSSLGIISSNDVNQLMGISERIAPNQQTRTPSKQFDWIRWGYTARVRPNRLYWSTGSWGDDQNSSCQLWGYTSKDFTTGAVMLWSGSFPAFQNARQSYNFTGGGGNTTGWSHYEIKNTGSGSWCRSCSILLQL